MNKVIAICFLFSLTVTAQRVEVQGQIKDSLNVEVPFASIVFRSTGDSSRVYGTLGDDQGSFKVEVPKDSYNLEISVIGIQPKTIVLDLSNEGSILEMGVIVVDTEVSLDEVLIRGDPSAYRIDLEKKTYDVSRDIVARGGTLSDVMQNLPSVQVESDGNVSIRGDQNVKILIDGRPSGLTSSAELFATIPASSIDKIEVITNPSSRYAAQGTAGIINVILKKGQQSRFNSSVEVFTGYRFTAGVNANISQSGESGSWYVNAGLGYAEPKGVNTISLQSPAMSPDSSTLESERFRNQYYYLINLGGTKTLNPNNTISGSITYRGALADNTNTAFYEDFETGTLLNASNRNENQDETNNFVSGNLSFDHSFKTEGHLLSLNVNGEYTKGAKDAVITTIETFPAPQNRNQDSTINDDVMSRYILSADYTLPIQDNLTLELGYQSEFSSIENDFSIERTAQGMSFMIPEFTDKTLYEETVHAFYGQFSKSFDKLAVKLGLRTEITAIDIVSETNDFNTVKNYTDWFPSAFFSYAFNEQNNMLLSISRRINRPGSWMFIPFSTFTDERNIFVGNPDINPSYVVATELGYTTRISNKLSLYPSLFYRKTTDEMEFFVEIQQITIGDQVQDIFASTLANIGDYTTYGAELGVSYKPFDWVDMYGELVLNGFKQRGTYRGASFDGDGLLVYGRYNVTFSLLKTMKFQIQNFYRGPIETGQYRRKGFYGMNLGISNELFKGNGSIAFNVRDVFNSNG